MVVQKIDFCPIFIECFSRLIMGMNILACSELPTSSLFTSVLDLI